MENIELNRFWENVKEELVGTLPESVHPWLYSLEFSGYDKGVLTVVTGQAMARDWLKKNHLTHMNEILQQISHDSNARFNIIYDESAAKRLKKETEKILKKEIQLQQKEMALENLSYMQSASNLNLKYKFENFVVGKCNKFAHDAAMAVAKAPATKYNPLFIYGSAGLGKTHLMQAIGHYTIFNNQNLKVKYVKTDDYINDFISFSRKSNNSIENMSKFYKKYTNIDIILIDDIQFIESKEKSMERMQHTFDTLYNKGKQIVITCDRKPKELPLLSKALCSRFEMGLMVELVPPELETRFEIVKKLADDNGIKYNNDALMYIAKYFNDNIRELEGAFTQVCAYAELNNTDITLDLAKEILMCEEPDKSINFDRILNVTANYYNLSSDDIKSTARAQAISTARHAAIYVTRELTNESFTKIADFYGKKHTTILFAYDKVKKEIKSNKKLSEDIREIKQALKVI